MSPGSADAGNMTLLLLKNALLDKPLNQMVRANLD